MDSFSSTSDTSSLQGKLLLVYGLGCFLISLCLNIYLGQQAQALGSLFHQRTDELSAKMDQNRVLEEDQAVLRSLTQDAVNFSFSHPDLREVLNRHIKFLVPTPTPPPPSH